jgi:hypothetical protein
LALNAPLSILVEGAGTASTVLAFFDGDVFHSTFEAAE